MYKRDFAILFKLCSCSNKKQQKFKHTRELLTNAIHKFKSFIYFLYVYRAYMRWRLYQFATCQVSPGMKCWSNALIYLHARTFTKLLRHFSNTQFHIKCCTALLLLFLRVFWLCFNFFFCSTIIVCLPLLFYFIHICSPHNGCFPTVKLTNIEKNVIYKCRKRWEAKRFCI